MKVVEKVPTSGSNKLTTSIIFLNTATKWEKFLKRIDFQKLLLILYI